MPITTLLPQVTAQFAQALRANALLTRAANRDLGTAPVQQGDTINIRLPVPQAPQAVTPGHMPTAPQNAQTVPVALVVDRFFERSMALTDKEVGEIEGGNAPQQINQMAVDLVEQVNADGYAILNRQAGRTFGTPGGAAAAIPFGADDALFLDALQHLDEQRARAAGRAAILDPVHKRRALTIPNFIQADRRGDAQNPLVTGEIGGMYGAAIGWDQLVQTQQTNAIGAGAITVNGVNAAGSTSISLAKGAGANWSARAGDTITIAGQTTQGASGPILYQYVIAADVTVVQGGNTVVQLTSPLLAATAGAEAVTVLGAGSTYRNSYVMHGDELLFASRPLQELTVQGLNPALRYVFQDAQTGITIRAEIQRQNYQSKLAFSVLYGWRVRRSGLITRLVG